MRSSLAVVLVLLVRFASAPLLAADFDPTARARSIAPLIDERTAVVVHVNLGRLAEGIPNWAKDLPETAQLLKTLKPLQDAGAREMFVTFRFVSLGEGQFMPPVFSIPLPDGVDTAALTAAIPSQVESVPFETTRVGDLFVFGPKYTTDQVSVPADRASISQAFAVAEDSDMQMVLLHTSETRKAIQRVLPRFPDEMGGGSTKPFARGCEWAVIAVNFAPKPLVRLTTQSPSEDMARDVKETLLGLQLALGRLNDPIWKEVVPSLTPNLQRDRVTVSVDGDRAEELLYLFIAPAIQVHRDLAKHN